MKIIHFRPNDRFGLIPMNRHLLTLSMLLLCLSMALSGCYTTMPISNNNGTVLSLATFNMRCDVPEDDSTNNWSARRPRIAHYIDSTAIDVVATQELVGNQDSTLLASLPQYSEVRAADGVNAIFYRTSQIEVLRHGCFSLSECPDSIGKKGWDAAFPRLALWAVMRHRATGKQFVVLNTHLDHIGGINRIEGAKLIAKRLKKIAGKLPVAVTGDFNADDTSEAYTTLTASGLLDAYKVAQHTTGVPYSWHNYGRLPMAQRSRIDFVLVSKGVTVWRCHIPQEIPGAMLSDRSPLTATLKL